MSSLIATRPSVRARVESAPTGLVVAAALIGLVAVTPLIYIALRALEADPDTWQRLWSGHIPRLVANTVSLALSTAVCTGLLGLALAWLVERTDVPGRTVWRWVLAVPIAIPVYVGALCYLILLRRGGLVEQAFIHGLDWAPGRLPLPALHSLAGATFVISLFTFPFVYLPVAAALRSANATLEEAARVGGRTAWGAFRDALLPLLRPTLLAGLMLVDLYVLSDFGTVALLRYRTFTVAIYNQFVGQVDRGGAAILSFALISLALPLLAAEAWLGRRARRYQAGGSWRPPRLIPLGRWRVAALAFIGGVACLSLGIPIVLLGGFSLWGWLAPTPVDRVWGAGSASLWQSGLNTLLVAVVAASLATGLAMAPAALSARYRSTSARVLGSLGKTGYALPGLIAALGLVLLFSRWLPALYATVVVLVLGFVVRFLPQSVSLSEVALLGVPPAAEQAARVLGAGPWRTLRTVTIPVAAPGLLAAWTLVFLTAMKELPTALLLRPPGFDTLPVSIWAAASESVYTQAAPPAFLLIVLTIGAVALLMRRAQVRLDEVLP